jgi:hypothetical protein
MMADQSEGSTRNRHTDKRRGPGRWGKRGEYADPVWPPEFPAAARVLRARGVSAVRIAQFFVTTRYTVYSWLRKAGE